MADDRRHTADEIARRAFELDPDERDEFLSRQCAGDPELRIEVEVRLQGRIEHRPGPGDSTKPRTAPSRETRPRRIGPYRIVQLIGSGGMGQVYEAEQQFPIRRRVALKVIKRGMDSAHVIARFEAERQALGLMDHPNIAKIFDAGTTDRGRPYFAMEYVHGLPITEHCDRHRLPIQQRLQLFMQVCSGVQHAHQKAILHRDIKPSNILVAIQSDQAVPKIIDFGLAKAMAQPLTERTLFTEFGQLVGTPSYMSPEQAEMTGHDIDTRTDVYSLGAVLYELLAGAPPFDPRALRMAGFRGILEIIREKEPPKPSTRVESLGAGSAVTAQSRSTDPRHLTGRLRGDLDWITMKAIEKNRARRYASASELAADVQRYLTSHPIVARPPNLAYQLTKMISRHRAPFAFAVSFLFLLAGFGAWMSVLYSRAEANLARAVEAESEASREAQIAQRNATAATIQYLVAESSFSARSNLPRGALLAMQAINIGRRSPTVDTSAAESALRNILASTQSSEPVLFHRGTVADVTVSPDGRWIAAASGDGTVQVTSVDSLAGDPMIETQHEGWANAVAFSPDSHWIASGGDDGVVQLSEIPTGVKTVLASGDGIVTSLAFSTDGTWLASATSTGQVLLWKDWGSSATAKLLPHPDRVDEVKFDPRSRWLATACVDGTARLWSLGGPTLPVVLHGHEERVRRLAFDSDGHLATGADDGVVYVWDLKALDTGPVRLAGHDPGSITALAFSPHGRWLASASSDRTVRIWNQVDPAESRILREHENEVVDLAFQPGRASRLATASLDGTVRLWECMSPRARPVILRGHEGEVRTVAFSEDGSLLVSGGTDRSTRLWNLAVPSNVSVPLRGHGGWIVELRFSAAGTWLATASTDRTVRLWTPSRPGTAPIVLADHREEVSAVAFSRDERRFATASLDGVVRLWSSDGFSAGPKRLIGHQGPVRALTFSPDGRYLATAGADSIVRIWSPERPNDAPMLLPRDDSPTRVVTFSPEGRWLATASDRTVRLWPVSAGFDSPALVDERKLRVYPVVFSPDGRWLATGGADRTIRKWDLADLDAQPRVLQEHAGWIRTLAFSPDNRVLAAAGNDPTVVLWDTDTDRVVAELDGHDDTVWTLSFSPDGRRLVSASDDGTARLWDMQHLDAPPIVLREPEGELWQAAFDPEGRWLATASRAGIARLWRLDLDAVLREACRIAGRDLTRAEWDHFLGDRPYESTCTGGVRRHRDGSAGRADSHIRDRPPTGVSSNSGPTDPNRR